MACKYLKRTDFEIILQYSTMSLSLSFFRPRNSLQSFEDSVMINYNKNRAPNIYLFLHSLHLLLGITFARFVANHLDTSKLILARQKLIIWP